MWALRCLVPKASFSHEEDYDVPRENTHKNMMDQVLFRDCFFSVGFVPDRYTAKGNFNWFKYNQIAFSQSALDFYKSSLQRIPLFMHGEYLYTDSENGLHPVALHYFMRKGVFAAVMTADGLWGWADSRNLQFNEELAAAYEEYCDKNVPLTFIPLTPTKRQQKILDAHIEKVKESVRTNTVALNRLPAFDINILVSWGDDE